MSCDYCDEREGIETVYNKIYGDRNRVLCETEHFSIFPCMGQLREGHLLIVSKEHINAMGMLKKDILAELESLVFRIGNLYENLYQKNALCFEHGVLNDNGNNGGCGIYHMHLHLVPIRDGEFQAILSEVKNKNTNKIYLSQNLEDTCKCITEKKTYVFLGLFDSGQKKESYIVNNSENYFESQYIRKVVCRVFGKKEWDWKKIKCKERTFLRTLEKCNII
ncbi:hypothetical protein C806_02452 [Lachnospiraceae bacterium 3-1]|nr:hypothetical protein C806_02452 [Lachnospiraceae bacterium 3-1]